jgi:Smg protein
MTESFLEILWFLYEKYSSEELQEQILSPNLVDELQMEGFMAQDVQEVMAWFMGFNEKKPALMQFKKAKSIRIYTNDENYKLSADARGFIFYLEQQHLLDGLTRELILQRAMQLPVPQVDMGTLRHIINIVLETERNHVTKNHSVDGKRFFQLMHDNKITVH